MSEKIKIKCAYQKLVQIEDLKPHPKNRNKHPKDQIKRLSEIIKYQGFRKAIIVSKRSGFITAGHGRLQAAKELGMKTVPVDFQEYANDSQEYADLQADNAIALWADLDIKEIGNDIKEMDVNLDMLGIKGMKPVTFSSPEDDEIPEPPKKAKTKPGDIYQLGAHRLLCGDSTLIDHVERLMDGVKADLWLTDPPYGVAYESAGRRGKQNQHAAIENDAKPLDEMGEFWFQVASNALICCSDRASYYWFACQGGDQMMMMMMMSIGRANWKVRHELIWVKDQMVFGRSDYHYKHEPILYGWKTEGTHEWNGDRKQTSVLEFPRPKASEEHPTMKPVELIEYLMANSSKPGQIVLDTFGGSGTTLIAAERTGRQARLVELSPAYCDVIVNRWEKHTGKKAKRLTR